jgi:F0F1-type ATP synthase epsilon subunit
MSELSLIVSTPHASLELDALASVRFLTHDGWRGLWPGHEPGRASLHKGPIRCVDRDQRVRWVATEGGVMLIDRRELRVLTRWAAVADTLGLLREQVEARDSERAHLETEARALARRHELATRRALMVLERKIVVS